MPNHCSNSLHVSGDSKQLDEFIRQITVGESEYRIAQLIPMPKALEGTTSPTPNSPEPHPNWEELLAKGEITQEWYDKLVADRRTEYEAGMKAKAETGYSNWWDWCNDVWGTKWGDYDHHYFERDGDRLEVQYETAWGPFYESFWEKVSLMFPGLEFIIVYEESGMDFAGVHKFISGKLVYWEHEGAVSESLPEVDWDDDESVDSYYQSKRDYLDRLYEEAESVSV